VVALLLAIVLAVRLRRVRVAQRAVLGDGDRRDLVVHAQQLEVGFTQLRDWLEESMEHLERRMGELESRVDGCVAHTALVRYDAYNELSGHQSSSLALLDSRRSGVVVSSIVHRDQARIYVKRLHDGEAEDVRSGAELGLPVRHCLVARPGVSIGEVTRVVSHPQALAQCAAFLRERLPAAERVSAGSTAEAVRAVAESGELGAAVGTRLSAELYGCDVLAEGIEDRRDNLTRFVWLAPNGTPPVSRATKTSVVF